MADQPKLRLGVNIDHVATVRNALGGALNSLGRYSEAAPLFETALATFQRAAACSTVGPRPAHCGAAGSERGFASAQREARAAQGEQIDGAGQDGSARRIQYALDGAVKIHHLGVPAHLVGMLER